jgi:hypothetical protein
MCLALLTLLRATLSGGPTRGSLLGLRGWEVELRLGVPIWVVQPPKRPDGQASACLGNPRFLLVETNSLSHHHRSTDRAWHCALHHDEVSIRVNRYNRHRSTGNGDMAHMARHPLTLFDFWARTKIGSVTIDGTRRSMPTLHAVRCLKSLKVMSLHAALETLALARRKNVNEHDALKD